MKAWQNRGFRRLEPRITQIRKTDCADRSADSADIEDADSCRYRGRGFTQIDTEGMADLSAKVKHEKYLTTADWRKRHAPFKSDYRNLLFFERIRTGHTFLFKTISFILIFAFILYDITWAQGGSPIWNEAKPNVTLSGRPNLNGIKIPYDAGTAQEAFSNGGNETIINVQDAHASLTAQLSIVKILQTLVSNYDLDLIALEGAEGPVDISLLKSFPDPEIRKETAQYLMRKGKMSAGEFFSIVSEKPIKLYGVEDNALYRENVEALEKVMENKIECIASIEGLLKTLETLEPKVYSLDLLLLNKNSFLHREGKLAFTKHWEFISKLAKRNNIEIVIFENLSKLLKSIELENDIDFKKANEERKVLIDELSKVLPKRELEKLVLESLSFKMGKTSQGEFHQYIIRLAEDIKISHLPYSNLIKFTRYITIYEDIDLIALFGEVEEFEDYIREKIFRNDQERTLYNLTKTARIIKKLFGIALDNSDYNFITAKKRFFDRALFSEFIKKSYLEYKLPFEHAYDLGLIFDNMEEAIGFYNIAKNRNNAMIANTIEAMRQNKEEIAALITGGFHSKGLAQIMKERNLSYLIIMPKYEEDQEQRPYIAVLTNKKQPYEELLEAGEYILAVRAYFYTANVHNLLESIFYSLGRAEEEGMPLLPLKQTWYSQFKNAYEEFGGVMARTWEGGKRPITPAQLAKILGLDDEGQPIPVDENSKTGIFADVVEVGTERVIVIRQYENGRPLIELALAKDKEGKYNLDLVPAEVKRAIRKHERGGTIVREIREVLSAEEVVTKFDFKNSSTKEYRTEIIDAVREKVFDKDGFLIEGVDIENVILRTLRAKGYIRNALFKDWQGHSEFAELVRDFKVAVRQRLNFNDRDWALELNPEHDWEDVCITTASDLPDIDGYLRGQDSLDFGGKIFLVYRAKGTNDSQYRLETGIADARCRFGLAIIDKNTGDVERLPYPIFEPEEPWEINGTEDPRLHLVMLDGKPIIILTYVALSEKLGNTPDEPEDVHPHPLYRSAIASISIEDFITGVRTGKWNWTRHGVIDEKPWHKNPVLFTEKLKRKHPMTGQEIEAWVLWNRNTATKKTKLIEEYICTQERPFGPWIYNGVVEGMRPRKNEWDSNWNGAGPAPIKVTPEMGWAPEVEWLLVYHGVKEIEGIPLYRAGIAILDKDGRVLYRTEPVVGPGRIIMDAEEVEKLRAKGELVVPNVCFPCGARLLDADTMLLFYGEDDIRTRAKKVDLTAIKEIFPVPTLPGPISPVMEAASAARAVFPAMRVGEPELLGDILKKWLENWAKSMGLSLGELGLGIFFSTYISKFLYQAYNFVIGRTPAAQRKLMIAGLDSPVFVIGVMILTLLTLGIIGFLVVNWSDISKWIREGRERREKAIEIKEERIYGRLLERNEIAENSMKQATEAIKELENLWTEVEKWRGNKQQRLAQRYRYLHKELFPEIDSIMHRWKPLLTRSIVGDRYPIHADTYNKCLDAIPELEKHDEKAEEIVSRHLEKKAEEKPAVEQTREKLPPAAEKAEEKPTTKPVEQKRPKETALTNLISRTTETMEILQDAELEAKDIVDEYIRIFKDAKMKLQKTAEEERSIQRISEEIRKYRMAWSKLPARLLEAVGKFAGLSEKEQSKLYLASQFRDLVPLRPEQVRIDVESIFAKRPGFDKVKARIQEAWTGALSVFFTAYIYDAIKQTINSFRGGETAVSQSHRMLAGLNISDWTFAAIAVIGLVSLVLVGTYLEKRWTKGKVEIEATKKLGMERKIAIRLAIVLTPVFVILSFNALSGLNSGTYISQTLQRLVNANWLPEAILYFLIGVFFYKIVFKGWVGRPKKPSLKQARQDFRRQLEKTFKQLSLYEDKLVEQLEELFNTVRRAKPEDRLKTYLKGLPETRSEEPEVTGRVKAIQFLFEESKFVEITLANATMQELVVMFDMLYRHNVKVYLDDREITTSGPYVITGFCAMGTQIKVEARDVSPKGSVIILRCEKPDLTTLGGFVIGLLLTGKTIQIIRSLATSQVPVVQGERMLAEVLGISGYTIAVIIGVLVLLGLAYRFAVEDWMIKKGWKKAPEKKKLPVGKGGKFTKDGKDAGWALKPEDAARLEKRRLELEALKKKEGQAEALTEELKEIEKELGRRLKKRPKEPSEPLKVEEVETGLEAAEAEIKGYIDEEGSKNALVNLLGQLMILEKQLYARTPDIEIIRKARQRTHVAWKALEERGAAHFHEAYTGILMDISDIKAKFKVKEATTLDKLLGANIKAFAKNYSKIIKNTDAVLDQDRAGREKPGTRPELSPVSIGVFLRILAEMEIVPFWLGTLGLLVALATSVLYLYRYRGALSGLLLPQRREPALQTERVISRRAFLGMGILGFASIFLRPIKAAAQWVRILQEAEPVPVSLTGWQPRISSDCQAIYDVRTEDDFVELSVYLEGGSPRYQKGEAFTYFASPVDLRNKMFTSLVDIPEEFIGEIDHPNRIQLFAIDSKGKIQYGTRRSVMKSGWTKLTYIPLENNTPYLGYSDYGFDPSRISALGIRVSARPETIYANSFVLNVKDINIEPREAPLPIQTESLLDFNWQVQTWVDTRGIIGVTKNQTTGELELTADLIGGHAQKSKGEIFLDLRYIQIPGFGRGPLDMSDSKITIKLRIPPGFITSPPNVVQLFAKSVEGNIWSSQYGNLVKVRNAGEIEISYTPTTKIQDPQGYTDSAFVPTKIALIGVKIATDSSSARYKGPLYITDFTIEKVALPEIITTPYLREIPVETPPMAIPEFHNFSGISLYYSPQTYGYDIGGDSGFSTRVRELESFFRDLKSHGVNVVRLFTLCDLRNGVVQFNEAGIPIGMDKNALTDFTALIRAAKNTGVKLIPVLFDHTLAEGVEEEGGVPVGEFKNLLTNPIHKTAFIDIMREFFVEIREYVMANNLSDAILAWEPMNEPELTTVDFGYTQSFVTDFVNIFREVFPEKSVSLSAQQREYLRYWIHLLQPGDIMQIHWYRSMDEVVPFDALDKPKGELNIPDGVKVIYGEVEPSNIPQALSIIHSNGYDGALFWHDAHYNFLSKLDQFQRWFQQREPHQFATVSEWSLLGLGGGFDWIAASGGFLLYLLHYVNSNWQNLSAFGALGVIVLGIISAAFLLTSVLRVQSTIEAITEAHHDFNLWQILRHDIGHDRAALEELKEISKYTYEDIIYHEGFKYHIFGLVAFIPGFTALRNLLAKIIPRRGPPPAFDEIRKASPRKRLGMLYSTKLRLLAIGTHSIAYSSPDIDYVVLVRNAKKDINRSFYNYHKYEDSDIDEIADYFTVNNLRIQTEDGMTHVFDTAVVREKIDVLSELSDKAVAEKELDKAREFLNVFVEVERSLVKQGLVDKLFTTAAEHEPPTRKYLSNIGRSRRTGKWVYTDCADLTDKIPTVQVFQKSLDNVKKWFPYKDEHKLLQYFNDAIIPKLQELATQAQPQAPPRIESPEEVLNRFEKRILEILKRGESPTAISDMEDTLILGDLVIAEKTAELIAKLLKSRINFVLLTGTGIGTVEKKFLTPLLSHISDEDKWILNYLTIVCGGGSQYYRYVDEEHGFQAVYAVDMESLLGNKYQGLIKTLDYCIEALDMRGMLNEVMGWTFTDTEWENFKKSCIEERRSKSTVPEHNNKITEVSLRVIGPQVSHEDKEKFDTRGGLAIRQRYQRFIERELQARGIAKPQIKIGGMSTLDITTATKEDALMELCESFRISMPESVYFGDSFGPGENDEPIIAQADSLVNVGRYVDIEKSHYYKKRMSLPQPRSLDFFQLVNSGPNGAGLFFERILRHIGPSYVPPFFKDGRLNRPGPVLVVHRIESLDDAKKVLDLDAQFLEVDVQMTKDSVLVAWWGKVKTEKDEKCVYELTLNELEDIIGRKILRIEDLFRMVKDRGALALDIKDWSDKIPGYKDAVLKGVNDLINRFDMAENIYATSFNADYLIQLKQINPRVAIGLVADKDMDIDKELPNLIKRAKKTDTSGIGFYPEQLRGDVINRVHSENLMAVANRKVTHPDLAAKVDLISVEVEEFLEQVSQHASPKGRDVFTIPAEELLATIYQGFFIPHVERATSINLRIGEALGLSKEQLKLLKYTSILHDVGAAIRGKHEDIFFDFSGKVREAFETPERPKISVKVAVDLLITRKAKEEGIAEPTGIDARYRLFRKGLLDILGKTELTDTEEQVAHSIFDVPSNTLRILKERGVSISKDLEVLLKYHNDYVGFMKDFPTFEGELSLSKEDLALLISLLYLTDIFEHGNNKYTQTKQRKKPRVENFPETVSFIEDRFAEINKKLAEDKVKGRIKISRKPLEALVGLICSGDKVLMGIVANARETEQLFDEDRLFIEVNKKVEVRPFTSERKDPRDKRKGRKTVMAIDRFKPGEVLVFPLFQDNIEKSWGMLRDKAPMHFKYKLEGQDVQDVDDIAPDYKHVRKDEWTVERLLAKFRREHPGLEIIGFVGNGNILMNAYLTSYVNGRLYAVEQEKELIHRGKSRVYPSLIMWKDGHYTIEEVRFTKEERVIHEATGKDITDEIIFINSGIGILKKGQPYDFAVHYEHDHDVRHYFDFPFIPKGGVHFGVCHFYDEKGRVKKELMVPAIEGKPITLELTELRGKKWISLADAQIDDLNKNLQEEKGYKPARSAKEVKYGTYFIDKAARTITIGFMRSVNPHNIVGIDKEGNLVSIMVAGESNRLGITFKESQSVLRKMGIKDAIIYDNGADAMMNRTGFYVIPSFTDRDRITSILIFAKRAPPKDIMETTADEILEGAPADIRNHTLRNERIATRIAQELGVSNEDISLLQHAIRAHDIGQAEKSEYPEFAAVDHGLHSLPDEDRVEPVSEYLVKWLDTIASKYDVPAKRREEARKEAVENADFYPIYELYMIYAVLRRGKLPREKQVLNENEQKIVRNVYSHGGESVRKLEERGISYPWELALLASTHTDYTRLDKTLNKMVAQEEIGEAKADRLRLLGSILAVSDVFEQGNNYERLVTRKGKPRVETFGETFNGFMRMRFDVMEKIQERRPLETLKALIRENDEELFKIIAEARETVELMPQDVGFIEMLRMHEEVKRALRKIERLTDGRELTDKVRKFELSPHELAVLEALENFLANDQKAFLNYNVEEGSKRGKLALDTFNKYREKADKYLDYKGILTLRWAMFLHDIASGRIGGFHPEISAEIAKEILKHLKIAGLNDEDEELIAWLIENHDVMGNIYTGERAPQYLLEITKGLREEEIAKRLTFLQLVTICDFRGYERKGKFGLYFTDEKANFWLALSNTKEIESLQKELFEYRMRRWTGNPDGSLNKDKEEKLLELIEYSPYRETIREYFGEKISYVTYGFYTFMELSPEELLNLMERVVKKIPEERGKITLEFTKGYRKGEPESEKMLENLKNILTGILRGGLEIRYKEGVVTVDTEKLAKPLKSAEKTGSMMAGALGKKAVNFEKDGKHIERELRRLNIIGKNESLIDYSDSGWAQEGGAETYLSYGLAKVQNRKTGVEYEKRFVAKAVVTMFPAIAYTQWQERMKLLESIGIKMPKVFSFEKATFYEEYIPYTGKEAFDNAKGEEKKELIEKIIYTTAALDVLGFTRVSEADYFRDLRSDGKEFYWVDVGFDLGGPGVRRRDEDIDYRAKRSIRQLHEQFSAFIDKKDIASFYHQSRKMVECIHSLRTGKDLAIVVLKHGEMGGLNNVVNRKVLSRLGEDAVLVEGYVEETPMEKVLQWWKGAIAGRIEEIEALPRSHKEKAKRLIQRNDADGFGKWYGSLEKDVKGISEDYNYNCLKHLYIEPFLKDNQPILLFLKTPREEILKKYGLTVAEAQRLLGGQNPFEVPAQDFVKEIMVAEWRNPHEKSIRCAIVRKELREGVLKPLLLHLRNLGLTEEHIFRAINAVHASSFDEATLDLLLIDNPSVDLFHYFLTELASGKEKAAALKATEEYRSKKEPQPRAVPSTLKFEIEYIAPKHAKLLQEAQLLQWQGITSGLTSDTEFGLVLISEDYGGVRKAEGIAICEDKGLTELGRSHVYIKWIQDAFWNIGKDRRLRGPAETLITYLMHQYDIVTGSGATDEGRELLKKTGVDHISLEKKRAFLAKETKYTLEGRALTPIQRYHPQTPYFTLDDINLQGKSVIVREDLNTTLTDKKEVILTKRIKAAAVNLKELVDRGTRRVAVLAHQGRPGDENYLEALKQHAALLQEEIANLEKAQAQAQKRAERRYEVLSVNDLFGSEAQKVIKDLKPGQILLLKNVRSWKGEMKKDVDHSQSELVKNLQPHFDFYVNNAFSAAHRHHASVEGFTGIPNVAGRLFVKEYEGLSRAIKKVEKPYIMCLGGLKIDDYMDLMEQALKEGWVDKILASGVLGWLVLMAKGYDIGEPSLDFAKQQLEDKYEDTASRVKKLCETYSDKFVTGEDFIVGRYQHGKEAPPVKVTIGGLTQAGITHIYDIGPETLKKFLSIINTAKTVYVKGTPGNFYDERFRKGTQVLLNRISERSKKGELFSFGGGGDTAEALRVTGSQFSFETLAGGAALDFLADRPLPGLVELKFSAIKGIKWDEANRPLAEKTQRYRDYKKLMVNRDRLAGIDGVIADFDGVDRDHSLEVVSEETVKVKTKLSEWNVWNITVTGEQPGLFFEKYGGIERIGQESVNTPFVALTRSGADGWFIDKEGKSQEIPDFKTAKLGDEATIKTIEQIARRMLSRAAQEAKISPDVVEKIRIAASPGGVTIYVEDDERIRVIRFKIAELIRDEIARLPKGTFAETGEVVASFGRVDIMPTSKGASAIQMIKLLHLRRAVLIADTVGTEENPGNDRSMLTLTQEDLRKAGIDWEVDLIKIYVGREENAEIPEDVIIAPQGKTETEPALRVYEAIVEAKDSAATGIVIGVVGTAEGELETLNRDKGISGVKFVKLNEANPEENFKRLEEHRRRFGAYATGIIEIGELAEKHLTLKDVAYALIEGIRADDRRLFALAHPDIVALNEETIAKIENIEDILRIIVKRLDVPISMRASELSVYELRIDKIAEIHRLASRDTQLAGKLAKIKKDGKTKIASCRVHNVAELRWLANEHRKAQERYGKDNYPIKLHIRLVDKFVTGENIDKVLKLAGVTDVITRDNVILEDANSLGGIYKLVQDKHAGVKPEDVAIGDVRDLKKDLNIEKDEKGRELLDNRMLFVKMEKGIASQLYTVIVELIANNNEKPEMIPEGAKLEQPNSAWFYFVFRPMKPIDIEELQREIEQYEKVLMAA